MVDSLQIPEEHHAKLAWFFVCLLILLSLLFLVLPLLEFSVDQEEQLLKRYAQLASYEHVLGSTEEYENQYEHIKKTGLDTLFYPKGLTSAQVGKELQKQLAAIITRDGGILVRSEVLDANQSTSQSTSSDDDQKKSIYQKVIVKANLQGSMKLLRNLLHQAYRARPFIFVEDLSINPLQSAGEKIQQLKAEVIISTYWRGGVRSNETVD